MSRRPAEQSGPPAIVLLSGGLDSATVLAIAREQGFACHALSFDYGQRHRIELDAARVVAEAIGVASHHWVTIDAAAFGGFAGSALTDNVDVPKDRDELDMNAAIPVTYVPARNAIFLAYAMGLAEVSGAADIFIGVNAVDYSGYPDCRPAFIEAFQKMANLATKAGVEGRTLTVHTPLIDWPKTRIIERGLALGVDYGMTHSCYDPVTGGDGRTYGCGRCDSCRLRGDAFAALGMRDPALAPA